MPYTKLDNGKRSIITYKVHLSCDISHKQNPKLLPFSRTSIPSHLESVTL